LRDLLEQLVEVEHRRDFTPELEQRLQQFRVGGRAGDGDAKAPRLL
jgi:hypothetical protein